MAECGQFNNFIGRKAKPYLHYFISKMKVLVFGFERFGRLTWNPSERVVENLSLHSNLIINAKITIKVLPTEYVASQQIIQELVKKAEPSLIVGLGAAPMRSVLCLERTAVNLDDSFLRDNAGVIRTDMKIDPEGPDNLRTSINLKLILKQLNATGIRARISNHAGTFVCNHVYYFVLRLIQREKIDSRCIFVHLPMKSSKTVEQIIEDQLKAVTCIVCSQM